MREKVSDQLRDDAGAPAWLDLLAEWGGVQEMAVSFAGIGIILKRDIRLRWRLGKDPGNGNAVLGNCAFLLGAWRKYLPRSQYTDDGEAPYKTPVSKTEAPGSFSCVCSTEEKQLRLKAEVWEGELFTQNFLGKGPVSWCHLSFQTEGEERSSIPPLLGHSHWAEKAASVD